MSPSPHRQVAPSPRLSVAPSPPLPIAPSKTPRLRQRRKMNSRTSIDITVRRRQGGGFVSFYKHDASTRLGKDMRHQASGVRHPACGMRLAVCGIRCASRDNVSDCAGNYFPDLNRHYGPAPAGWGIRLFLQTCRLYEAGKRRPASGIRRAASGVRHEACGLRQTVRYIRIMIRQDAGCRPLTADR